MLAFKGENGIVRYIAALIWGSLKQRRMCNGYKMDVESKIQ